MNAFTSSNLAQAMTIESSNFMVVPNQYHQVTPFDTLISMDEWEEDPLEDEDEFEELSDDDVDDEVEECEDEEFEKYLLGDDDSLVD
ncbi:MAG: hypothetical protein QF444_03300 [Phycisphaerales bacterium]|jgi:hypothetical protein|nr:hypothetical protein [Phycisphaerales bacterium]MDP6693329.1 hypothetical protein [Phycisphaerales bacterium]